MVAQKHKEKLNEIKDNVRNAYNFFSDNNKRYHNFRDFIYNSTLSDSDVNLLQELDKPIVECNTMEAYISRLCGEFIKNEPSITVSSQDGKNVDPRLIKVVEGHIRHILSKFNQRGHGYKTFEDAISGGYGVFQIFTEYRNNKTFDQDIIIDSVLDPTMCFFDPLAKNFTKSDGKFCGQFYPVTEEEFKRDYPNVPTTGLKFYRDTDGLSFSYMNSKHEKIIVICEYYEKKIIEKKLVKLAFPLMGRDTFYKDEYDKLMEASVNFMDIGIFPTIQETRKVHIEKIVCYKFIEQEVLEYYETDFHQLPYVFCDGNSKFLTKNQSYYQMTRPYLWNVKGIQKVQNVALQNLAHELEMRVQHKWMVANESLPSDPEYLEAYQDVQKASTLIYNSHDPENPDRALPPPQAVPTIPMPPEILSTLQLSDQKMQAALGSYDGTLGINKQDISGKAVVEGADHSNSAAKPYFVGYIYAINQIAKIILELIPYYYKTPRSITVLNRDGSEEDIQIKHLRYDQNIMHIKVEAGVSFTSQKSKTLQQLIAMSNASPTFGEFINQDGLKVLLDNMEVRGLDELKQMADEFLRKLKQKEQMEMQAQQMAIQNNPQMLRAQNEKMKIIQEALEAKMDNIIKVAQLQLEKQRVDNETIETDAKIQSEELRDMVQMEKADAEKSRSLADIAIKQMDVQEKLIPKDENINIEENQ